ncbi:hypothetical protein AB0J71_11640 [Nonomuraea sp. NPDC049637]|uniref:hypothetical protein n=1 Tax=Nonomuraea sp. NPDC049637 TaxID=3154356 RepID=UPI0034411FB1
MAEMSHGELESEVAEPGSFTALLGRTGDEGPSFRPHLAEVQTALLDLLSSGTDAEKAGSARAWYWTQVSLKFDSAENLPTNTSGTGSNTNSDHTASGAATPRGSPSSVSVRRHVPHK